MMSNAILIYDYVPKRMEELGYGTNYYLRQRLFVVAPGATVEIEGFNQLYILTEDVSDITITSEFGLFDLSNTDTNEQQYEHQGAISIINVSTSLRHVPFLHIIPKHPKNADTV